MSGIFDQCRKPGFLKYSTRAFTKKWEKVTPAAKHLFLTYAARSSYSHHQCYKSKTIFGALGVKFYWHLLKIYSWKWSDHLKRLQ